MKETMIYAGQGGVQQFPPAEEERPVSRAMTELASTIGDVETVARALLGRVAPLIPGGSPFERAEKMGAAQPPVTATPQPVRSHFCDQIDARTYQLRELANRLNEAFKGIEL